MKRVVSVALAAFMVCLAGMVSPAMAKPGNDAQWNQPKNWEQMYAADYEGVVCYKIESGYTTDHTYVVPAPPEGHEWVSIIVKAGSKNSVDDPNKIYKPVAEGDVLTAPEDKEISHIILCSAPVPPTVTKIPVPAKPAIDDPCNASGVTNNASWIVPEDTDSVVWALVDGELIASTTEGYEFTDGTTEHNFGLPTDSGRLCVAVPELLWTDPCNAAGTVSAPYWTSAPVSSAVLTWTQSGTSWIATPNAGYEFIDGQASHTYSLPMDDGLLCDVPVTEIAHPVMTSIDPCNAVGGVNAPYWTTTPVNDASVTWTQSGTSWIAAANAGYEFVGALTQLTFTLPADNANDICPPIEVPIPPTPTVYDPCFIPVPGVVYTEIPYNASWIVPADTAQYYWVNTADQVLTVFARPGYTFPGGATSYSYGQAPDKGSFCAGGTA